MSYTVLVKRPETRDKMATLNPHAKPFTPQCDRELAGKAASAVGSQLETADGLISDMLAAARLHGELGNVQLAELMRAGAYSLCQIRLKHVATDSKHELWYVFDVITSAITRVLTKAMPQ